MVLGAGAIDVKKQLLMSKKGERMVSNNFVDSGK